MTFPAEFLIDMELMTALADELRVWIWAPSAPATGPAS
jgi:hypothetical protein